MTTNDAPLAAAAGWLMTEESSVGRSSLMWPELPAVPVIDPSADRSVSQHNGHMFEGFALRWINVDDHVRLRVRVGE